MTEQQLEAKLEAAEEGTPEYCSLLSDLAELKLHNVSSSECCRGESSSGVPWGPAGSSVPPVSSCTMESTWFYTWM